MSVAVSVVCKTQAARGYGIAAWDAALLHGKSSLATLSVGHPAVGWRCHQFMQVVCEGGALWQAHAGEA